MEFTFLKRELLNRWVKNKNYLFLSTVLYFYCLMSTSVIISSGIVFEQSSVSQWEGGGGLDQGL